MNEIWQGIQTALVANTDIINGLGGTAIYRVAAPELVSLPYIITWIAGGDTENITPDDSVDIVFGVKIVTKDKNQAGTIMGEIRSSLHRQDLTLAGNWKVMAVTHETPFLDVKNAEGSQFFHGGGFYRVRAVEEN